MRVAFVVLHYCQIGVTIDCISSLLNLKGSPLVVVVDNASPDGSGILLEDKYKGCEKVSVILNDRNVGFATANNMGFAYAKNELGAELIAVINNDTVIEDVNFVEKLTTAHYINEYHIIAPDIINKSGEHQNPFKLLRYDECIKNYKMLSLLVFIYSIPLIGEIKARLRLKRNVRKEATNDFLEMIVPHGAAIIYTPLWVKEENIAFRPGTFMYLEEEILYYYVISKKYKTAYAPDLKILHLEDVSTNASFKNVRKKCLFQCKQMKKSYKVLIDFLESNNLKIPHNTPF